MSKFNTKQALVSHLINNMPSGLTDADVTFENKAEDQKGKALWLAAYFIPATSDSMGKDATIGNEERGIFQVSVFVKLNSNDYDNKQLQVIDEIIKTFNYNAQLVYNEQRVQILNSESGGGFEAGGYFQRNISIEYLTFSTK